MVTGGREKCKVTGIEPMAASLSCEERAEGDVALGHSVGSSLGSGKYKGGGVLIT